MYLAAVGFGAALIALGVWGYTTAETTSPTALIPAAFGLILLFCGVMARNPQKRKTYMHIAAGLGLLGFLGGLPGLFKFGYVVTGAPVARPHSVISQSLMSVLCIAFTWLCVRSFASARRNRTLQ